MGKIKVISHLSSGTIMDVETDQPLILIISKLRAALGEQVHQDCTVYGKVGQTSLALDLWKSIDEQMANPDDLILIGRLTAGGGALPIRSLIHHQSDLRKILKNEHRGLKVAFLYTSMDKSFKNFMESFLHECISLSKNSILFAPMDDFTTFDSSWWDREYPDGELKHLVREIPLFHTPEAEVYKLLEGLGIPPDKMPCMLVFDSHVAIHTLVSFTQTEETTLLLETMRKLFGIINEAGKVVPNRRIRFIENKMRGFKKEAKKRQIEVPITFLKIEFNGVKLTGASNIFESLFPSKVPNPKRP